MPKQIRPDELDSITKWIAGFSSGASLDQLARAAEGNISKRTLQRRLAALLAANRIVSFRDGRQVRFRRADPTATMSAALPSISARLPDEFYVPTSTEGEAIKTHVRQPIQARRPVGYDIRFLESYHPNVTFYLPEALRAQLRSMGRSPAIDAAAGTFARDILSRLIIDLSWASSRLEGNTYNLLDTERLVRFGEAAEGKDAFETQMILNHKAAIEYLVMHEQQVALDSSSVIALHALLSDNLLADPAACGRLRDRPVEIGGSVYRPIALPQKIEELFGIMLDMANEIIDPLEKSFFLMVHLPYLQPFEDVNKRVSRLAANLPLIRHNLCPITFIDVPERAYVDGMLGIYELCRIELLRDIYVWAYERSCQQYVAVRGELVPPDTFRLRYRRELGQIVRDIVRSGKTATASACKRLLPKTVLPADQEAFIRLAMSEFGALHAGNVVRFGLRPLEFEAWKKRQRNS